MAIIRHGPAPEDHYSLIPNGLVRNPDISLPAKGLYLYLRSHREGWEMSGERIAQAVGVSRMTVNRYLVDLEEAGYLVREQTTGEDGTFKSSCYTVLCTPLIKNESTEEPCNKSPYTEKPVNGEMLQHKKTNSSKKTNPKEDQAPQPPEGAHRLPDDWRPSQDLIADLLKKHPGVDLASEATKFRDYWHQAAGATSVKKDWDKAFRNWVRKAKPSWQDKRNAELAQAEAWSPRTGIIDQEAPF